jgi:hypothetical protein
LKYRSVDFSETEPAMFKSGRHMDKAGFGNRPLLAIYDEIDFRSQIGRIVHIAAYESDDFIMIRMGVFGMRPRYGAYDPHGFNIKRSRNDQSSI